MSKVKWFGDYYFIPEAERYRWGDYCDRRRLIADETNRPIGHFSRIMGHEEGFIWHQDFSGCFAVGNEDAALQWMQVVIGSDRHE